MSMLRNESTSTIHCLRPSTSIYKQCQRLKSYNLKIHQHLLRTKASGADEGRPSKSRSSDFGNAMRSQRGEVYGSFPSASTCQNLPLDKEHLRPFSAIQQITVGENHIIWKRKTRTQTKLPSSSKPFGQIMTNMLTHNGP